MSKETIKTQVWNEGQPTKKVLENIFNEIGPFLVLLHDSETKEIVPKKLDTIYYLMTERELRCYDYWLVAPLYRPCAEWSEDSRLTEFEDENFSEKIRELKEFSLGGGFMYSSMDEDASDDSWFYSNRPIQICSPEDADFFEGSFRCYPIPEPPKN